MQKASLFCFHLRHSAEKSYRMLIDVCDDNALSDKIYQEWFLSFKDESFFMNDKIFHDNQVMKG